MTHKFGLILFILNLVQGREHSKPLVNICRVDEHANLTSFQTVFRVLKRNLILALIGI